MYVLPRSRSDARGSCLLSTVCAVPSSSVDVSTAEVEIRRVEGVGDAGPDCFELVFQRLYDQVELKSRDGKIRQLDHTCSVCHLLTCQLSEDEDAVKLVP